ncbi:molybdopterin synthase catalytic subunit MoaE [Pantoea vagans]|uniref:molybdopterin synthase catalytic subunit MoaE n=1 Tax=Pantoea vagans TaxID=470934 RepID=UPI0023B18942|nr:molybdopterin synthase catalytic subunit MoaE [Pantoea vagans]MDE8555681.1 molybdopterin synthase catalytic subunit MoaE [Pantoea vagans]MDE8575731.1 molybdopterin synthase catalytic subunit MoaE [Pantoea vagans]
METQIRVGPEPFDMAEAYRWLAACDEDGAVVTFTGKVRNHNLGDNVAALTLEHYPGMTEKALQEIVDAARERWPLQRVTVIHRVGELFPGDEIVLVGVTSAHRGSAFSAAEFIMDYLKKRAPFWKREATEQGDRWVDARDSDHQAAQRWD